MAVLNRESALLDIAGVIFILYYIIYIKVINVSDTVQYVMNDLRGFVSSKR